MSAFVPTENRFVDRQFDPNDPPAQQLIDMIMAPYYDQPIYASIIVIHEQSVLDEVQTAFQSSGRICAVEPVETEFGTMHRITVLDG